MADPGERVGVVFVSHSEQIARGLVDLARQMAPTAVLAAAGGTDDGRIGTSFDRVSAAIAEADRGAGAVLLCDLGSAILTAETALEFLDDAQRERVRIVDAPLVEGGVAAAVAAEAGEPLAGVVAAAQTAGGAASGEQRSAEGTSTSGVSEEASDRESGLPALRRTVTLVNEDGLHARPAAELVKLASKYPQRVTVNGVDAKSLLAIMALGLHRGAEIEIVTEDPAGEPAIEAIADLAASGFGEA